VPFDISLPELLIVLVAVLLIFGPKRLPEMGRSLGKGIRQFKDSVTGVDELTTTTTPPSSPAGVASDPAREDARRDQSKSA